MALATTDQVVALLEEEPTPQMLTVIASGLDYASDLAEDVIGHGYPDGKAPPKVSRIVAFAVARWVRNPDGFQQNRAGDETLAWFENKSADPGEIYFTAREIERLQAVGAPRMVGFGTFGVNRFEHGRCEDDTLWVSTTFGRYGDFPLADRHSKFGRWLVKNG